MVDSAEPDRSTHEAAALESADRVVGDSRARWALRLAGRIAGRLLGLVLLVAGLAKATDPVRFSQEIANYHIVTNAVLTGLLAYAVVIVECGIGAALLVNLRPRIALALAGALLVVFLIVVGTAWSTGSTGECGCFGPWKPRSPAQAFVEDLFFIAVVPWAWWGRRYTVAPTNAVKLAIVGLALAAGVMVPAVAGMTARPGSSAVVGSDVFRTLEVKELPTDLSTGEHLVLLMSTECTHCQAAVPSVNALANDPRLPKVVAISMEDRVQRGLFREDYGAQYPIGEITKPALYTLLEKEFPRMFLVRDGRIVAVWNGAIPTADDIIAAQTASRAASNRAS